MAERDQRSGEDLLRAVVLGYDPFARVSRLSLNPMEPVPARASSAVLRRPVRRRGGGRRRAPARLDPQRVRYMLSYNRTAGGGAFMPVHGPAAHRKKHST